MQSPFHTTPQACKSGPKIPDPLLLFLAQAEHPTLFVSVAFLRTVDTHELFFAPFRFHRSPCKSPSFTTGWRGLLVWKYPNLRSEVRIHQNSKVRKEKLGCSHHVGYNQGRPQFPSYIHGNPLKLWNPIGLGQKNWGLLQLFGFLPQVWRETTLKTGALDGLVSKAFTKG